MTASIRKQVLAQLVAYMATAQAEGCDPYSAAEEAFPGTPVAVLGEAWAELDCLNVEAWWQTIEKTIDAELIVRALAAPEGSLA